MTPKPRSAEMHPGSGFRVKLDFPRLDPALTGGIPPDSPPPTFPIC